jgi:hypothetical protein
MGKARLSDFRKKAPFVKSDGSPLRLPGALVPFPATAKTENTRSYQGGVSLWGQAGEFIVTVGAMRVRIELKGMFGIGSTSCAFDAVCRWLDDSDTKRYPANNQFGSKYRSASPS